MFTTPAARDRHAELLSRVDAELIEVSSRAFASLASTETTQEVLALLQPRRWSWEDLTPATALVLVLDGVQDPGNAGAIVRSAEAFGATGVVFLEKCARVANAKFLRATAGSIFRLPYLESLTVERSPETFSTVRVTDLCFSYRRKIERYRSRSPITMCAGGGKRGPRRLAGIAVPGARHLHSHHESRIAECRGGVFDCAF